VTLCFYHYLVSYWTDTREVYLKRNTVTESHSSISYHVCSSNVSILYCFHDIITSLAYVTNCNPEQKFISNKTVKIICHTVWAKFSITTFIFLLITMEGVNKIQ